jgi:hypothetical protein
LLIPNSYTIHLLRILFPSSPCTGPHQCNLCSFIVSLMFMVLCIIFQYV